MMNKTKRILILCLCAIITFNSVFFAYKESVQAADIAAGIVAAVGGAPLLTALVIGGVVVAGGIAIYEFTKTDSQDFKDFGTRIKTGFNDFIAEQEKVIAKEENVLLTDQEAANIGVAKAREYVNNFWDNAIDTTKNTVNGVKKKAMEYWNLYSKLMGDTADLSDTDFNAILNNSGSGSGSGENLPVQVPIIGTGQYLPNYTSTNNCRIIQGKSYIVKGKYLGETVNERSNCVTFVIYNRDSGNASLWFYNYVNDSFGYVKINRISYENLINSDTNIPIYAGDFGSTNDFWQNNLRNNWVSWLLVSAVAAGYTIQKILADLLNDTKAGKSIRTGRKELDKEGDHIGGIFKDNSIPVDKSTLRAIEIADSNFYSGDIGWSIPDAAEWDDYINGTHTYDDVVDDIGAIAVPTDSVREGEDTDTSIDFPRDTDVQDTSDYPRDNTNDQDVPQQIPERPIQDIIDEQGGTFYPMEMTITDIFPFCIPFDIIALVEKFDVGGEKAPVITIPIMYPSRMASALGTDRYNVVIDFQDYIILRNIIRVFLLIGFLIGLMKITRELIRG